VPCTIVGENVHLAFLPRDSKAIETSITTSIEQALLQKMLSVCEHTRLHVFHGISPERISKAACVVCLLHNNPSSDTILSQIKLHSSNIVPSTTTDLLLTDLFEYFHFFQGAVNQQMYTTRELLKTFPHNRSALLKSEPYSCLQS